MPQVNAVKTMDSKSLRRFIYDNCVIWPNESACKNITCLIPQHAAEQEKVAVNSLKELPLLRDKKRPQ